MNRTQLSEQVAERIGAPKTLVQKIIVECQNVMVDSLRKGNKITISGFGTYSVSQTAARVGRNPRTGEPVKIAPKRNIKFHSSFEL